jgi:hypothetical protein
MVDYAEHTSIIVSPVLKLSIYLTNSTRHLFISKERPINVSTSSINEKTCLQIQPMFHSPLYLLYKYNAAIISHFSLMKKKIMFKNI